MLQNSTKRISLLFCFFFMLGLPKAFAQNKPTIDVNHQKVLLHNNIAEWLSGADGGTTKVQSVLLQFTQILSNAEKQNLFNANIQIKEYIAENTYSAWILPNAQLDAAKGLLAIGRFSATLKINPAIAQKAKTSQQITLFASFYPELSRQEISAICTQYGASILQNNWEKKGIFKLNIASKQLLVFADDYRVRYISEPTHNIPLDMDSKGAQAASILNMPKPLLGEGLNGNGTVIGIGDNTSGVFHIDQADRIINYNVGDKTDHGVFVNSIVGGDGIMDLAGQGIATDATFLSHYYDVVLLLKEEMFKGHNMTLTNNSYAAVVGDCAYSGTYDLLSQNLDSMAFATKEQLDVFAAGNDGRLVCGAYPAEYYNICGGFQTAKNIISVGATSRDLSVYAGSSRGPIRDGRLKPEMTAVGINIMGAINDNSYKIDRGTSFSCPQVTGVLALLSERYKQLNAGSNPKSDLLKAIILNGTSDYGRPGPDFWYGFGFLNAARSLDMVTNKHYTRNTLASGAAAQSFNITVPSNTAQLKVMLYYHDPMASASASKQLVNDLDITVTEPGGTITHRPLILDPSATGVMNNAVEGVDRLNNAEQVTINNPTAGTYTISVADFVIPKGPQEYVVVYDFVPQELKINFPIANAVAAANADMYIYWDAPYDAVNTSKIEFSSDNGASWTTIATAVPANQYYFQWATPTINSPQCKIKITRASFSTTTGAFVINAKPVLSLAANQCSGSFAINWSSVPSADKYYLLLKKGAHFQKVDSVNATVLSYTYKGLNPSETYYVAVQPAILGAEGYRSNAIFRKPNNGNCAGVADGDIAAGKIISPNSGRRATSSELKINTPISVQIRNQDNDAVANYSISYKVNTAAWKTLSGFTIAANTTALVVVDTFDFRDTITYTITLAIHNLDKPDPVSANDTIVKVLKHLPNNILSLSSTVFNDFESLPDLTLYSDTIGFSKDGFWDYATSNTDTGRMRTRIPGSKLVKSSRSLSMDVNVNNKQTVNYVTATFNLSNYDTSIDEVRFDFDYEMRGMPVLRDSNKVWVRGSDLLNWIPVYTYSNVYDTVKMHNSGTLSLREIFAKNNHAFSTSTQIRFGQYDTTLIVDDNFGGGLTIDNVRLYKVLKDVQLTRVVAPTYSDCEIATTDVSLMVRNGTVNTVKDIAIAYSLGGGAPIVEAISDSLLGNDSLLYIFKAPINSLSLGKHSIKAWIHTIGDDFPNNDTISDYIFYNSAYVNQFPILQNMEDNDGGWYVNGRNPSWAWGVPNGNNINTAASGSKVWKTNLNGNYNASELSYLVSPCYNTIGLANPMISFSTAFDLERCVAVCDRVYIEYSWDNEQTWTRLGTNGKGTNWYNNEMHNVWNGKETRWHVSSFELPRAEQLKLRFVMASDMGTNYDGFAIDDIHIYDRQAVIAKVNTNINTKSDPQNIDADKWSNVLFGNELLVAIRPSYLPLANIQVQAFAQNERQDTVKRQYIFPRSYLVSKPTMANESGLRLFITDAEANKVLDDTSCATCTKPVDIYRTGITQFVDDANNTEDNLLGNNSAKGSTFRPYNTVAWVPYDDGYYAEFNTKEFGEFWLNNGGILGTLPANTQYVALAAQRYNDDQALLIWQSPIDTQMKQYKLLRSTDNVNFELIDSVVAQQKLGASYQYYDVPKLQTGAEVYYKLQCAAQNDKEFYSNTASLSWTLGHQLLALYPVPSGNGQLRVKWTGPVNAKLSYFLTDMTGKNVFAGTVNAGQWQNESVIDLNFLAKGMYIIHLQIGANNYTEKVIFK